MQTRTGHENKDRSGEMKRSSVGDKFTHICNGIQIKSVDLKVDLIETKLCISAEA